MGKISIFTDSSSNLSKVEMEKYNIRAILPMHIYIDDVEHNASGDWEEFSATDYYNGMTEGTRIRSSQITSAQYEEEFRKALEEGDDILSISCAEALSSSVKESIVAKNKLSVEYPNAKIVCIDSYNCTYSLAMIVIHACKMRNEGKTIEEIEKWIYDERSNFNECGTVQSLTYLRNAGRVSASAAFFGGIFSVKPIVVYDETGHNVAIEKVRGRSGSLNRVAEYVKQYGRIEKYSHIGIAHANCLDDATLLSNLIQEKFPDTKIEFHFGFIEAGVGSSVGPGTIIVCFYGDPELRKLNKK